MNSETEIKYPHGQDREDKWMKCEIARDLLPLYVEDLCSEETKNAVKEHMEHCESCQGVYSSLKAPVEEAVGQLEQEEAPIEPMKKVKKKIRRKNRTVAAVSILAALLAAGLLILSYNQINHQGISFEVLYEYLHFQYAGREFAKGNIEPLLEALAIPGEDNEFYAYGMGEYASREEYVEDTRNYIRAQYQELFQEKTLRFKAVSVTYNSVETGYHSDYRYLVAGLEYEVDGAAYLIRLQRGNNSKFSVRDGFVLSSKAAYASGGEDGEMAGAEMPSAEMQSTEMQSTEMLSELLNHEESIFHCLQPFDDGYWFGVKKMTRDIYKQQKAGERQDNRLMAAQSNFFMKEEYLNAGFGDKSDYREKVAERLQEIVDAGFYLKDFDSILEGYDKEKHMYVYMVVYTFEDKESGACAYLAVMCHQNDSIVGAYMLADIHTVMLETSAVLSPGVEEKMLSLWD